MIGLNIGDTDQFKYAVISSDTDLSDGLRTSLNQTHSIKSSCYTVQQGFLKLFRTQFQKLIDYILVWSWDTDSLKIICLFLTGGDPPKEAM